MPGAKITLFFFIVFITPTTSKTIKNTIRKFINLSWINKGSRDINLISPPPKVVVNNVNTRNVSKDINI